MKILFKNKRVVTYIGRNGFGKQIGISVLVLKDVITLSPINSKGNIANCSIDIPIADLPALMQAFSCEMAK